MADRTLNRYGMTELHLAAYHGELVWVRNCLAGGLSVHARYKNGYTPLCWCADMGMVGSEQAQIATALIRAGSDVNARDSSGRSVLAVARNSGNDDIIRQLVAAGAVDDETRAV